MEPKVWQLKNRIKYVERLRNNVDKQWYGSIEASCGVCALGCALRTMRGMLSAMTSTVGMPLRSFFNLRSMMLEVYEPHDDERQKLSEFLGLNYLELLNISDRYEETGIFNCGSSIDSRFTHQAIAGYIEKLHIKPYLWMIEKHYTNYKTKVKLEL